MSREPDTLRAMTWASINCAYARLAQIVGLHRVVNMTYRMAESPYLYLGQPEDDRAARRAAAADPGLATGANEMSPLDMASGAQTIANEGLHNEPYYVDYIDTGTGSGSTSTTSEDIPILDRGVALTTIDVLKGVLTNGTGAQLAAQRDPGGRQDRDAGREHERLVRRVHPQPHHGGVDRRPERLHADAERAGVRGGEREQRAGRSLPCADLEHVHAAGPPVHDDL